MPRQTQGSKEKAMRRHGRPIMLKGFIRRADDQAYEGICLTLNLPVRGRSIQEVESKLRELIAAYLEDAEREGRWDELVPRRAPLSYYATYYWYWLLTFVYQFFGPMKDFKLFIESAPSSLAHA